MRLRVSGEHSGRDYALDAVIGNAEAIEGIAQSDIMNAFCVAVTQRDSARIAAARAALIEAQASPPWSTRRP